MSTRRVRGDEQFGCRAVKQSAACRVFVDQTAAVIYAHPSSEADIVTRLERGLSLDLMPTTSDSGRQWISARTDSGLEGFLPAAAKTITAGALHSEREKMQRGYALGRNKMLIETGVLLFSVFVLIAPLLMPPGQQGPVIFYFGAIAAGAGQFLWGVEQVSFVRRALNEFDTLWDRAFSGKGSKPLF